MRILICAVCGYQWNDEGEGAKGIFEMDCPVCEANIVNWMREDNPEPHELPWW